MRVAWVVTGGFDRSGRERVIPALVAIVDRLARRHDVHVFALRHEREPNTYSLGAITVHDLGRPEGLPRQHAALRRALQTHGPFDLLHAYWGMPAGVVGTAAARRLGIPSIVCFDSGEFVGFGDIPYGLQRRLFTRLAVGAAARLATQTIVCTEFMAALARRYGCHPRVLPLGIDTARFIPSTDQSDGPPWRLVHVASLNRVKNQALLLRALRLIVDQRASVHLDVLGEDTLDGEIQRVAKELGLAAHVTFHGFQPTDAVVAFLQRAHVHVMASRHEAAGVSVLEAAACGVPTVAPSVGYVADWSPDRAVAVAAGDAPALAEGVIALLDDPERRRRIALAARAWTLAHDVEWTVASLETLYLSCRPALRPAG